MKRKGHIRFWLLAAVIGFLMYYFPMNFYFPGLMGLLVFIYVARFIYDRRQKSKPEPPKKEHVCCPRCSGDEPWPGGE